MRLSISQIEKLSDLELQNLIQKTGQSELKKAVEVIEETLLDLTIDDEMKVQLERVKSFANEVLRPYSEKSLKEKFQDEVEFGLIFLAFGNQMLASPTPEFWAEWKKNKESLKKRGYRVFKDGGWFVSKR